jgi:2-polyprenyl-6-methoxyphenol hydroxylase-like FAD-dependent oxidoreductase
MLHKQVTQSAVIAGAGPVGLLAAVLLVRAGFRVIVLEKFHGLTLDRRASTFHPATLDLLEETGLAEPLVDRGSVRQAWQYMIHGTKHHAVFDLDCISDVTRHPYRLQCEQYYFSDLAMDFLLKSPLFEVRFGHGIVAVEDAGAGVRITAGPAGDEYELVAPWLIAADGGNSTVRQALNLTFRGERLPSTSITLVLNHPFQDEIPGLLGINYVWTRSGYYSLIQLRDLWRFSYSPKPGQDVSEALSPEVVQAYVQDVFPSLKPYELLHIDHYTLQQRCLDSFRQGRVLFVGDAAHLISPTGGMGMNAGMHDAHCLVEHLLPVMRGEDDGLLDRYSRRRQTIALEEIQRLSERNFRWHRETNPERRQEIWRELQEIVNDEGKTRDFLLDSSMIRSRWREKEIS